MLKREDILAKAKTGISEIEVEGYGKMRCKDVSFATYAKVMTEYSNAGDQDAALFCECIVDEEGKPMFTFEEVAKDGILNVNFVTAAIKEITNNIGKQAKN